MQESVQESVQESFQESMQASIQESIEKHWTKKCLKRWKIPISSVQKGVQKNHYFKSKFKKYNSIACFPKKRRFQMSQFLVTLFFQKLKIWQNGVFSQRECVSENEDMRQNQNLEYALLDNVFSSCNPHAPFNVSRRSTRRNSAFYTSVRQKNIIWHWMGHGGAQVLIKKSLKMAYRGTTPFFK